MTLVRSVYAYGTEVAVSFYYTHTRVTNYCIPAGHVSATLLTSTKTLSHACMKGAGHETRLYIPSPPGSCNGYYNSPGCIIKLMTINIIIIISVLT